MNPVGYFSVYKQRHIDSIHPWASPSCSGVYQVENGVVLENPIKV